jgi:hypothetical protein
MDSNILYVKQYNELKKIFKEKCEGSFINNFSKKIYNLFVNNIIFKLIDYHHGSYITFDTEDDPYYLGVYYQYININYELMNYFYTIHDYKDNKYVAHNLGLYYQKIEKNQALAEKYLFSAFKNKKILKKYYHNAIKKGDAVAMNNMGLYCYKDNNVKLMSICYDQAIDMGNVEAIYNFGRYYDQGSEPSNNYYLMAIKNGYDCLINIFDGIIQRDNNYNTVYNILLTMIEGNIKFNGPNYNHILNRIRNVQHYTYPPLYQEYMINTYYNLIISMCRVIDNKKLCIDDFNCYSTIIITFIQTNKFGDVLIDKCISEQEMINTIHFIKYIGIVYYRKKKENIFMNY